MEGGPRTVIEALMDILRPEGTLVMPSFNHNKPFDPGGPGYYHPGETPTINGAIPDAFWRLPGVFRSLDPTHPFAAWGRHARRYTAKHHRTLTMGPHSPLGLLCEDGGFGLLLGVGYEANTFHHVVEMTIGAPCLGLRTEAYPVILPGGREVLGRTWGWRGGSCPFTDNLRYVKAMESYALHKETQIGSCRAILFKLNDCFEVVENLLRRGKDGFPPCIRCPVRPRRVPQTVESDWDPAAQSPFPDSTAWTY